MGGGQGVDGLGYGEGPGRSYSLIPCGWNVNAIPLGPAFHMDKRKRRTANGPIWSCERQGLRQGAALRASRMALSSSARSLGPAP